jgi:hypothetical protein
MSARVFGFFTTVQRTAGSLGPFLFSLVGRLTGHQHAGFLAVMLLFFIGLALLLAVDYDRGARACAERALLGGGGGGGGGDGGGGGGGGGRGGGGGSSGGAGVRYAPVPGDVGRGGGGGGGWSAAAVVPDAEVAGAAAKT